MILLEPLKKIIRTLEIKQLYLYMGFFMVLLGVVAGGILSVRAWYVNSLMQDITEINEQREQVRKILTISEKVRKQRTEVDKMLTKNEGFKIGGYLEKVLKDLKLADKKTDHSHMEHDLENNYRETVWKVKFVGMNMEELCELLKEFERNERVYTKELEIARSAKRPNTLDIVLAIATLEPRTAGA